jgi:ferrochelatase
MTPATPGAFAAKQGVVVMAYGTPASTDEIEAYYTHIRGGRPPEPEQLADLERRYGDLGGVSPMAERTRAQVDGIAAALGNEYAVSLGQKHSYPFIEDAVTGLCEDGVNDIVGLVLAPHFSAASVGLYLERAAATSSQFGVGFTGIESWNSLEAWLDFNARAVTKSVNRMPERTTVVFTAHSLPESVLAGDPYADELQHSANAIARRASLAISGWSLGWQSAAKSPMPWRGPDISEIIADIAETGRADGVVVCPQGFTCDHLEVLHDIDIVARDVAKQVGLEFARTDVVNADPTVMSALADLIRGAFPA